MENNSPELEVRFWPFSLKARGENAIAAVRLPLAVVLFAIAIAILAAILFRGYWVQYAPAFRI